MSAGHAATVPSEDKIWIRPGHPWAKLPMMSGAVGVIGIGLTLVMGMGDPKQLLHSYLVAFLYFLSIALGSLFFVLVQFLSRSGWSVVVRRTAENFMAPLPLFAVLFLPILLGMGELFHWAHPGAMEHDPVLKAKEPYLNTGFFLLRAVVYFAIWSLLSFWFRRRSIAQDTTGDVATTRGLQALSAPGVALLALSLTFAAFDWAMSLDPHWYSTMWGVWYFAGALVSTYATLAVVNLRMQKRGLLEGVVTTEHFHDLGKLCFAFTVFWTYISFSQYFLIWYANIPEETVFFAERMGNSWESIGWVLMVGHFAIPFFFLLPRTIKRNRTTLLLGALWILLMHYFDLYYAVMPNLHHEGVKFSPLDVLAMVGIGGLYLGAVFQMMKGAPLIPVKDPRLAESLAFENF